MAILGKRPTLLSSLALRVMVRLRRVASIRTLPCTGQMAKTWHVNTLVPTKSPKFKKSKAKRAPPRQLEEPILRGIRLKPKLHRLPKGNLTSVSSRSRLQGQLPSRKNRPGEMKKTLQNHLDLLVSSNSNYIGVLNSM